MLAVLSFFVGAILGILIMWMFVGLKPHYEVEAESGHGQAGDGTSEEDARRLRQRLQEKDGEIEHLRAQLRDLRRAYGELEGSDGAARSENGASAETAGRDGGEAFTPPAEGEDDLTRVDGVDEAAAAEMRRIGVTTHAQLAMISDEELDKVEAALGRGLERDELRNSARMLTAEGPTGELLDEGVKPPAEGTIPADPALFEKPAGEKDDLQVIRGIGPVVEQRLNAMGVTTIRQIAELRDEDIQRIDDTLDFKGRVQREDWVGQAQRMLEQHG